MSASIAGKDEYLLLFRGAGWTNGLSPEQMAAEAEKFMAWFERLKLEGKCKGGQPLKRAQGALVAQKHGRITIDGPFVETKETIGGYFLIVASDFDEAVKIAEGCPGLARGMTVEVRAISDMCPDLEAAQKQTAYAAA